VIDQRLPVMKLRARNHKVSGATANWTRKLESLVDETQKKSEFKRTHISPPIAASLVKLNRKTKFKD
jgi:hypothetical protein